MSHLSRVMTLLLLIGVRSSTSDNNEQRSCEMTQCTCHSANNTLICCCCCCCLLLSSDELDINDQWRVGRGGCRVATTVVLRVVMWLLLLDDGLMQRTFVDWIDWNWYWWCWCWRCTRWRCPIGPFTSCRLFLQFTGDCSWSSSDVCLHGARGRWRKTDNYSTAPSTTSSKSNTATPLSSTTTTKIRLLLLLQCRRRWPPSKRRVMARVSVDGVASSHGHHRLTANSPTK